MADTAAQAALRAAFNSRLPLTGGTMTGSLILSGDPSSALEAATKQYVDNNVPSISWDSLTGKPTFATVATSGSYNDLLNKPTIPSTPNAYVTQTWRNGENWYNVWSNGFIEQGGLFSVAGKHQTGTCSLNKNFSSNQYTLLYLPFSSGSFDGTFRLDGGARQTSYFNYNIGGANPINNITEFLWLACGY